MKRKILLFCVMMVVITVSQAQNRKQKKQEQKTTGYAITAIEKGGRGWKEVRLVDMSTGAEVRSVYQSSADVEPLNARTGKPIVKQEAKTSGGSQTVTLRKKVVNLDQELDKAQGVRT